MKSLRIATRESALALWQANHVKTCLEAHHPELSCVIHGMTTEGDRNKASPLNRMGGKGVFIRELEMALQDGSVHVAVHSMKDLPGQLPAGLEISAMLKRANPADAMVSNHHARLADLPNAARVGSSSLRRVRQLQARYPALEFAGLRGNVDTRLRKLDAGDYDAIILAVAGLERLDLGARVTEIMKVEEVVPAAGQGAIGIEARSDDEEVKALLESVDYPETSLCVNAERQVTQMLGSSCNLPVGVHAFVTGEQMTLRAFVSDLEGEQVIQEDLSGDASAAQALAQELGQRLLDAGAGVLIN